MAYIWSGHCSCTVSITRVVTAHDGCAQFAVLHVYGRNVGVFAWIGLVNRRWAVRTGRAEFGWRAVKVWYQRWEGCMGCHTSAWRQRACVAVLPTVRLRGYEWGMLGGQASWTVRGYRQVCVLMVVTGVEGFTWAIKWKTGLLYLVVHKNSTSLLHLLIWVVLLRCL